MLAVAVKGLNKLDNIVPAVRNLGIKHVEYGVKEEHYATVGAALLWTLEQGLGEQFTDDAKEAWTEVYSVLSDQMLQSAGHAA